MDKITENLHNVMRHDPLTNEMSGAINVSIDDLDARISGFVDQLNVDTASWGLDVYEHELGIPIDHSKPLDQRRSVIKSKLRGSGKVGAAQIKLVADSYSNGDVSVTLDKGIVIEFTSIYGVPDNIEDLKKVLREIAPAHLSLSFIFKYVLYGDIKDKQYSELSAMSYNELVNKGAASNYSLSLNALGTTAHGLPLIDDTMTADVPRDYNALSQAVDTAITEAVSSIEVTPESIGAASSAEFDEHKNNQDIHVTVSDKTKWNAAFPNTGGELNGDMTLTQGKKIKVKAPNGSSIDAIYHQGGDQNGTALGIGAGGLTVVGAGESAKTILNNIPSISQNEGTEELLLAADTHLRLWSNLQNGVAGRKEATFDNAGNFVINGNKAITEGTLRVRNGKLEFWDGSAWKGVGGGGVTHLVNSTTVVQEKTTGNVILQADERKFLFAFYPKGTGAINVYASFKDPEIAMENQRAKIIFTSSTRYGSSATRPDLVKADYHSISGNGHETYFDLTLPQGAASRSANNTDSEAAFDVRLPPGSSLTLIGRIVINNTSPITFEISNPSYVEQTLTALQLRYTIKEG
ncbi:putative phage tail protein [Paenibacillus aquistagni]|uniref:DUF2313 domain-containing protein n=1 Tax=Paenibacillus aquistagni TaxID=1852522 RepID=A0A1X7LWA2_9BACL|nr:putative phage tail protein [Paenibacillus aquistagni]SMG58186.1 hypothetical protein SAMN06295960_4636 [Paenibacillus aquistagni]